MRNVLLLFVLLTLICSCKRWQKQYPEDVERTKCTPFNRLIGKVWTLRLVTLNGTDITKSVQDTFGDYKLKFNLQKVPTIGSTIVYNGNYYASGFDTTSFVWTFSNDDNTVGGARVFGLSKESFILIPYDFNLLKFRDSLGESRILRLEETHFKISYTNTKGDTVITNYFTL